MNINKNTFIEVLKILESDECIDSFDFYKNENTIKVCTDRDDVIYHFDNNNNLINPHTKNVRKERC